MSACPDCGAAVEPEFMADHLMRHGILPEERPEAFEPKSPGADSAESPPADSAAGAMHKRAVRAEEAVEAAADSLDHALYRKNHSPDEAWTLVESVYDDLRAAQAKSPIPERGRDAGPLGPLRSARCDLDAVDRELDGVGKGDGFRAILAAMRAQTKVQAAVELIDGAWVDLGGGTPGAEGAPANGGTEGGVLDVTGFPWSANVAAAIVAALNGYRAGAGRWPDRVRLTAAQREATLDGSEEHVPVESVCGIPLEVVDDA